MRDLHLRRQTEARLPLPINQDIELEKQISEAIRTILPPVTAGLFSEWSEYNRLDNERIYQDVMNKLLPALKITEAICNLTSRNDL